MRHDVHLDGHADLGRRLLRRTCAYRPAIPILLSVRMLLILLYRSLGRPCLRPCPRDAMGERSSISCQRPLGKSTDTGPCRDSFQQSLTSPKAVQHMPGRKRRPRLGSRCRRCSYCRTSLPRCSYKTLELPQCCLCRWELRRGNYCKIARASNR
jgi:hypothetical protein